MTELPLNQILQGNCIEIMQAFPRDSIDLVVTSPPYWGLRDYGEETVKIWGGDSGCEHEWGTDLIQRQRGSISGKSARVSNQMRGVQGTHVDQGNFCVKCGAWYGSLGLEPHPQMFINHLVEICREIKRVLKTSGSFWFNLGDTYCGSWGSEGKKRPSSKLGLDVTQLKSQPKQSPQAHLKKSNWLQPKQLLGIPWRVATALQHDGWILRNAIVWHKPNHMPSSVKDRLTNAYESVFLLVKARKYHFDLDAIRQPVQKSDYKDYEGKLQVAERSKQLLDNRDNLGKPNYPIGKNPGDVWKIPTAPFPGAHFAVFPPKLIEPIIKAGSPKWICSKCGKPRTRINIIKSNYEKREPAHQPKNSPTKVDSTGWKPPTSLRTGWSDCGCNVGWVGSVVLDPFAGSGTVGQVARRLGRRFILIEMNPEYCKMAEQRVRGRYKAVPKNVSPLTEILTPMAESTNNSTEASK